MNTNGYDRYGFSGKQAEMDASWFVWVFSALLFVGVIRFLKAMPNANDFRMVAGGLGILGLAVATTRADLRWHLLWFTPLAIVAAYFYALRQLLALSHRVNKLSNSGISDVEQIRKALQSEVDDYNRAAPDDAKMR